MIADKRYGPAFTPHLVKSCPNAAEAEQELVRFLGDPDDWYLKNKIPGESVEKARVKATRIRKSFLRQETVEVFASPNYRLKQ